MLSSNLKSCAFQMILDLCDLLQTPVWPFVTITLLSLISLIWKMNIIMSGRVFREYHLRFRTKPEGGGTWTDTSWVLTFVMGLFIAFREDKELGEEKATNNICIKWQEIACLWSSFQSDGLNYWVFIRQGTRYARGRSQVQGWKTVLEKDA